MTLTNILLLAADTKMERIGGLGYPNMDVLISGLTKVPKQTTEVLVQLIFNTHAFII